jgi:uncharacterized FlaG/YvyC family protein
MGTVDGINPIIVDNIKVPTQKPAINKTQRSKITEERKDRDRNKKKSSKPRWNSNSLEIAVERLNQLLLADKIPLYFQIVTDPKTKVRLISADQQRIISELSPERILEMAHKFDPRGFAVNELI